ncbi:MAG TPA: pyruvate, phosphate dikinase [Steroidobacteraceae bacterium]|nr:pyruvate, phosphate dikinase [Steroidobacteraceae bacterium]
MEEVRERTGFVRDIRDPQVQNPAAYGGKASGLAKMAEAGIPIPPAFVIGTAGFHHFHASGGRADRVLMLEVEAALERLEKACGKVFGGEERPLLLSVRSGAAVSMPGMMDTVLNLGLTARSAFAMARGSGNPAFVLDTWMRFWRMFTDSVLDSSGEDLMDSVAATVNIARQSCSLPAFEALEAAVVAHLEAEGLSVSRNPMEQLEQAIAAVFRSWNGSRARAYRKHHGIADDLGTAVTIQEMVFGNADRNSGSGVAFTRNPNDGSRALYGEYLIGMQGEDLVAGTRTPIDLSDPNGMSGELRQALQRHAERLEALYQDALDIEFTVEAGKLFLLQVRPAKRTAAAAIRIAEDLVAEGVLPARAAVRRISVEQLRKASRPVFDERELAAAKLLAQGFGSSPGHTCGAAVLDADRAAERAAGGEPVILLRPTTSPQDIRGMLSAHGIVTAKGGALSHAAVVSRALDKACIVGCGEIQIELASRTFTVDGRRFEEGHPISIDGSTGKVFDGKLAFQPAVAGAASLRRILRWADEVSGCEVWPAPKSVPEARLALDPPPAGVGPVGLTDLLIANDAIDRFVVLLVECANPTAEAGILEALSALTASATETFLAELTGLPVHIRLPRVSSDRARRLVEAWTELPPSMYLPLGNIEYVRALLAGIAAGAKRAGHTQVTVLLTGMVDRQELEIFRGEAARAGLTGGALLHNIAVLRSCTEFMAGGAVWMDIFEVLRTGYGLPSEIGQDLAALDEYVEQRRLAQHPLRTLAGFLADPLAAAARASATRFIGIDCSAGCPHELLSALRDRGFRRFSASIPQRQPTRLLLGQTGE